MIRSFVRGLYGSEPKEFVSAFGLAESVTRLQAATKRSVWSALAETAAVGKVSENAVRLQRVIPMINNSFKPFFIGRFELRGGVTVLTGRFTLLPLVKAFMSFWFGVTGVAAVVILVASSVGKGPDSAIFVLQPPLMIAFGIGLVAVGKWFARNDVAWLSGVIAGALGSPLDVAALRQGQGADLDPSAVPMTLKGAAAFLAASGVMELFAGFAGPHLMPVTYPGSEDFVVPQFGRWNFAFAAAFITLAIGIWRRRPWAWWWGFWLVGASFVVPMLAMVVQGHVPAPIPFQVFFAAIACVVMFTWGRWWYAQRRLFLWE